MIPRDSWSIQILAWLFSLVLAMWLLVYGTRPTVNIGKVQSVYDAQQPLRFPINAGVRELKIASWLDLPSTGTRDPRNTHFYKLFWRFTEVDEVDNRFNEVDIITRGSWFLHDSLLYHTDRRKDATRSVMDNRTTRIELAEGHLRGLLEVRLETSERGAGLAIAVFEPVERSQEEQALLTLGEHPALFESFRRKMGLDWSLWPKKWKENVASKRARSISVSDDAPDDLQIRKVETLTPRPDFDDSAAFGVLVWPGGVVTYNLQGDTDLTAAWYEPDGNQPTTAHTYKRARTIDPATDTKTSTLWTDTPAEDLGKIGVMEARGRGQWTTVEFCLDANEPGPKMLRTFSTGPLSDRSLGNPPRIWVDTEERQAQHLAPDFIALPLWRVLPEEEGAPLTFPIKADEEVRIDLRVRQPQTALPGFSDHPQQANWPTGIGVPATFSYRFVSKTHTTRWKQIETKAMLSSWERYIQGDNQHTASVAEPVSQMLARGAVSGDCQLEVKSSGAIDVAVHTREKNAPTDILRPEYDNFDAHILRYEPRFRKEWRSRYPINAEELFWLERAIRVDAQVRFGGENRHPDEAAEIAQRLLNVRPHRLVPFQPPYDLIAEPHQNGNRRVLHAAATTIHIDESKRLRIDYIIERNHLGRDIVFKVNDVQRVVRPTSLRGSFRLEDVPAGPARVSTSHPGVFLAHAPGDQMVRRVWRLSPGQTRTVSIPADGSSVSVHVVRKVSDPSPASLYWQLVDGHGSPLQTDQKNHGNHPLYRRDSTVLSISQNTGKLQRAASLKLSLRDRVTSPSTLKFTLKGGREPVWVWVTAPWGSSSSGGTVHWTLGRGDG